MMLMLPDVKSGIAATKEFDRIDKEMGPYAPRKK